MEHTDAEGGRAAVGGERIIGHASQMAVQVGVRGRAAPRRRGRDRRPLVGVLVVVFLDVVLVLVHDLEDLAPAAARAH